MSLKDLEIQGEYRSDTHNLLRDFYIPCLKQSVTYSRAVGFFSSSSLSAAAQGITALIRVGGTMQLVASPHLSREDADEIAHGLETRDERITRSLLRELEQEFNQIVEYRLECLAWLLQHGVLDIKLAIPRRGQQGIYHEKLGIFADAEGNQVAFTGSANESSAALIDNFECIDVFWSWEPALQFRVSSKVNHFQRLWSNQTENLETLDFPEAARRSLVRLCPKTSPVAEWWTGGIASVQERTEPFSTDSLTHHPTFPSILKLRPYQREAIQSWFANKGRGTLKMATGSGKTITALAIATELYQKCEAQNQPLQALLIVCPYRHLVTQWAEESRQFGLTPILAFDRMQTWQGELQAQLLALMGGRQQFLTLITTNATLRQDSLQSQLPFFPRMTLIIGDEAHNFGASSLANCLPENIPLRLALSATPERYFDEAGTERIFEYFGAVLTPEFTLKDAIQAGALVPYTYTPILVTLTDAEVEQYADLTARIGKALGINDKDEDSQRLKMLLVERARLLCTAQNKLMALRSLMTNRLETCHTLFYCGDGSIEDETSVESQRQLEAVTHLLSNRLGYRVRSYVAETTLGEREELRFAFERGHIQGLVAIRCLDEGVDIPAIQTAVILASSSNPRQFIQRRGRILRRSAGKHQAELFDMVVVPPDLGQEFWPIQRKVLRGELTRFVEFAKLALNSGEARKTLYPLQEKYELLDL